MHPVVLAALMGLDNYTSEQADERRKDRDFDRSARERERMLGIEGSARAGMEEEAEARRREGEQWDDEQALTHEQNRADLPHNVAAEARKVEDQDRQNTVHDWAILDREKDQKDLDKKTKEGLMLAKKAEALDRKVSIWIKGKRPMEQELITAIAKEDVGQILRTYDRIDALAQQIDEEYKGPNLTDSETYLRFIKDRRNKVQNAHAKPKPEGPEDIMSRFRALIDQGAGGGGDQIPLPGRRAPFAPGTTGFQAEPVSPEDREEMIAYLLTTGQALDRAAAEAEVEKFLKESAQ